MCYGSFFIIMVMIKQNDNDNLGKETVVFDFGPCCACGGTENVKNVIGINRLAPTPGKGWGCKICGLPSNGAVAVVCDDCLESEATVKFACAGYALETGRVLVANLKEAFGHLFNHEAHSGQGVVWRLVR